VILDGATLEILNSFDLFGNWIVAMSLFATESKDCDKMLLMDADGTIYSMRLDMEKQKCLQDTPVPSFVPPAHTMGNAIDLQYNPFDPKIFLVLERDFCEILHAEFSSLARITKELNQPSFQGAKFLSAKTLLIWNERGGSSIYYLGATSDLKRTPVNDLAPRNIVLVSDGREAIFVDRLDIGPYPLYNNVVRISLSHTSEMRTSLFPTPINQHSFKQCLISISSDQLQHVQVEICPFWASLFGSNMKSIGPPAYSTNDIVLSLPITTTISMKDVWDIKVVSNPFTAMTAILKNFIAVGYLNGDVAIVPQAVVLTKEQDEWSSYFVQLLEGHCSPITALHVADYSQGGIKKFLLSGDKSGHVILWNASSGTKLGSFYDHSLRIVRFLPVPQEVGGKYKNSVMSIGHDHTVSLINVEECSSVSFVGHGKKIVAVYWRSGDHSVMLVHCNDGALYIWHLRSGHLDRIERGANVADILASTDTKLEVPHQQDSLVNSKHTFSVATFPLNDRTVPVLAVILINVKRLVDEMSNGELSSPVVSRKNTIISQSPATPDSPKLDRKRTVVGQSQQQQKHSALDLLKKAFPANPTSSRPVLAEESSPISNSRSSMVASPNSVANDSRGARPDTDLVGALFSCIMSWGLSEDLDQFCVSELNLRVPSKGSIGVRGAGGYLAFPIMSKEHTALSDWCYSSSQTAQRLLTIVATIRSLVANYGLPHDVIPLMRRFGSMTPNDSTVGYKAPSLSVLVKFWQDSIPDIQEAARFLIARVVTTMSNNNLNEILTYWSRLVPVQEPIKSKARCRAAVILGLIGAILPESLNMNICNHVCMSLERIIKDPGKNPYRLLAIELIGFGFKTWEPHLNGPNIIRTLVNLTGLKGQQPTGLPYLSPPNMLMARQSLMQIASINTGLFISTISFDLVHSKEVLEKVGGLKLLGLFITRVFWID
jgi:WD40 repeat protein